MIPNFSFPFVIETYASNKDLGVILTQNGQPMAFLSQPLSNRDLHKSVYER